MRAHGAAVQAYRAIGKHEIGLVVNIEPKYAATDSADDAAAVRRAHAYMNEQYLHPALLGRYPPELKEIFGDAWPEFPPDDFKLVTQPLDFIGINYYTRSVTEAADCYPLRAGAVKQPLGTYTETGWEVFPQGLTDLLLWFKQTYGDTPLYVTENGAAFFDPPVADTDASGARRVRDPLRTDYLRRHLWAIHDAIAAGVDIRGYMAWSLMDNLEWSLGYGKRFGLVHVNYGTQERTPKDSARWYSRVIETHGGSLAEPLP
jgi:beta-glucosidase